MAPYMLGDRHIVAQLKPEERPLHRRRNGQLEVPTSRHLLTPMRCANCGCSDPHIAGGSLADGEAVCSDECYDEHDALGCPLEQGDYRLCPHR